MTGRHHLKLNWKYGLGQILPEEVFSHQSLINISLRAGFIEDKYRRLLQKGNELGSLINENLMN